MQNVIEKIKANQGTLLDVRSKMEYDSDHIHGAVNIPLDTLETKIKEIQELPKPLIVYCMSGGRSGIATNLLQQNGITETYNGGGIFTLNNIINNN
ncbi:MAG: rhodanese-like domain-containing protein [Sediminibacterium sp.]|jgi:phage shock protein E